MKSLNEVNLVGNLTRDPELRYTPNGKPVITFGLATNESIKNKDGSGYTDVPDFHNIVFWGKAAETISKYCNKGNKLYIKGRLHTRKYTDKSSIERYITEVVGRDFLLLTPKSAGAVPAPAVDPNIPTDSAGRPIEDIVIPDDLPHEETTTNQDEMPF